MVSLNNLRRAREMTSPQPSVMRQDRLTSKLVHEVVKQVMLRQPTVGMSVAEEQFISDEVRRHVFTGQPLQATDMDALVRSVLLRRPSAPAPDKPKNVVAAEIPPRSFSQASTSQRSSTRASASSRRASTPSHARSRRNTETASICESDTTAKSAMSTTSSASRMSIIRDRDRKTLEALTELCALAPTAIAKAPTPAKRAIVSDEALVAQNKTEIEAAAKAALVVRQQVAAQQAELRAVLAQQIAAKKAQNAAELVEERRERDLRVAAAAQSLADDEMKQHEQRRHRIQERLEIASEVAQSVARKKQARIARQDEERAIATEETMDHELKLKEEHKTRQQAVLRLREELLSEAEKKIVAKKQQQIQQLEYELKLLDSMTAKVDEERRMQETQRANRIAAAKATQDACRQMAEEAKKREALVKQSQDTLTIDGDKSFIQKEKHESAHRRRQNKETQDYLQKQILERQLRAALQRNDDEPYLNKERIDEVEAKHREVEEMAIKRQAQKQWREFLTMQQHAKIAMKAVSEVAVSITRPASTTPWF